MGPFFSLFSKIPCVRKKITHLRVRIFRALGLKDVGNDSAVSGSIAESGKSVVWLRVGMRFAKVDRAQLIRADARNTNSAQATSFV